jgi:hypothetical protein
MNEIVPADHAEQPAPTSSSLARNSDTKTVEEVELEIFSPATGQGTPGSHLTQDESLQSTQQQPRTWWEWMASSVSSLAASLNPSYEYGKRPAPATTVPEGAVAVAVPRTMSGPPHEQRRGARITKTALLARALEHHDHDHHNT